MLKNLFFMLSFVQDRDHINGIKNYTITCYLEDKKTMDHLVYSVNKALENGNYIAALYLSLTLPDICARIESADHKTSKTKYIEWFNAYLSHQYKHRIGSQKKEHVFLTGDDLYALRCAVLHEGRLDISKQNAKKIHDKFFFTIGHPHLRQINSTLQLDLPIFCKEICDGVSKWVETNKNNKDIKDKLEELLSIFSGDSFSTNGF